MPPLPFIWLMFFVVMGGSALMIVLGIIGIIKQRITAIYNINFGIPSMHTYEGDEAYPPSITYIVIGTFFPLVLMLFVLDPIVPYAWSLPIVFSLLGILGATTIIYVMNRAKGSKIKYSTVLGLVLLPLVLVLAVLANFQHRIIPHALAVALVVLIPVAIVVLHYILNKGHLAQTK